MGGFKDDVMVLFRYPQLYPLCIAVFVSMLGFGLVMPLLPIYARDFGATGTQLGLLTASFAVARIFTTFPGGWLADKAGRKKPIIIGLLVYSFVMAIYGFSQDATQLILLRGLQGTASGIVWPIISTMAVEMVLPKDRGKAIGLYEMMHFLGMVVGPGLGGILAVAFNLSVPFFVCGALALFSSLLVTFTVKETFEDKPIDDAQHENFVLNLDSEKTSSKKNTIIKAVRELTPYASIFIGLCIARFVLAFSNSLMQPILSVYANEEIGLTETGVGILFTVQGVATLFATLPMGTVADNIGRKPMIILGKIIHASAAFLVLVSGGFWPLLLIMSMRGFGRAVSNPSITALFSGLTPVSKRGRSMGVFNIFQNIGLVAGATVGGFLYEFSSVHSPFIAATIVGFVGVLVVFLTVAEPKRGLR